MKTLELLSRALADGTVELRAPSVGWWRGRPAPGTPIAAGGALGELDTLGARVRLVAPCAGVVVALGKVAETRAARVPVEYGEALVVLDARAGAFGGAGAEVGTGKGAGKGAAEGAELVFCAPSSGRFYSRSSPESPPFVSPGDELANGRVVCLLEVMKTFNRIEYGGDGLPPRARVVAVLARDGDDLDAGQPILSLARIG